MYRENDKKNYNNIYDNGNDGIILYPILTADLYIKLSYKKQFLIQIAIIMNNNVLVFILKLCLLYIYMRSYNKKICCKFTWTKTVNIYIHYQYIIYY